MGGPWGLDVRGTRGLRLSTGPGDKEFSADEQRGLVTLTSRQFLYRQDFSLYIDLASTTSAIGNNW